MLAVKLLYRWTLLPSDTEGWVTGNRPLFFFGGDHAEVSRFGDRANDLLA